MPAHFRKLEATNWSAFSDAARVGMGPVECASAVDQSPLPGPVEPHTNDVYCARSDKDGTVVLLVIKEAMSSGTLIADISGWAPPP
jgi:hypothetical protein